MNATTDPRASGSSIKVDTQWAPVIVVRFTGVVDDAAFERYLAELHRALTSHDKVIFLYDALRSGMTPSSHRQLQAEWMKKHQDLLRARSLGTVFVFASAVMRLIVASIFLLAPMPNPHEIVGTIDDARRWVRERLRQAGIKEPPGLDALA